MGRRSNARDRLIANAGRLFRHHGFEAVGVAQLCKEANVNKGSFYHFFSSKRELLIEVLDNAWDETGLLTSWETKIPDQPIEQLRQYLQELFAYHYAEREANGRVCGSLLANVALELSAQDEHVNMKLNELFNREIDAFRNLLTEASNQGKINVDNPVNTAKALVACLHGLIMLAKISDNLEAIPNSEVELLRLVGNVKQSQT